MAAKKKSGVKTNARKSAVRSAGGSSRVRKVSRQAEEVEVRANLGATQTLPEFLATTGELSLAERLQIVDQAQVMIEQIYVHLPLKRAMHAVDPLQRLRLLRLRLGSLSERDFHDEMISLYTGLRDLHTNYILPAPFNSRSAVLPFRIEEFFEDDQRKYLVTQVSSLVTDRHFRPGVVPTHWNGVPMERAVELNAEREAGSNPAARRAQGLRSLTNRWMGMSLPPDEEWVVLRYLDGTTVREARFEWLVLLPGSSSSGVDPLLATGPEAAGLGLDVKTEVQRRVLKLLFAPDAMAQERRMASVVGASMASAVARGAAMGEDLGAISLLPDVFSEFRAVETTHGRFGYIRIRTFNVDPGQFVAEFIRIAALLPQEGLILDVRGNGGGIIAAGEMLLQVLTPRPIDPERFSLISSPLTSRLCERIPFLQSWAPSLLQSIETGSGFSQGLPMTPVELCNSIGQKYHGPTVLVTDALCYSTTDMFAAGYQDHEIGPILGVSDNTGAGGANVWTHEFLRFQFSDPDSPFQPLPRGSSFRVSIRRSTRVGERSGVPLEDLGVIPDELHGMTRDDILNENVDLIEHAASLLASRPAFVLRAEIDAGTDPTLGVTVRAVTGNLDRLDVYVDRRPMLTLDVQDGPNTISVPGSAGASMIELRGFLGGQLAASTRLPASAGGLILQ